MKNFIPTIWAATILRALKNNLVAKQICNLEYEGEIKQKGDSVKFTGLSDVEIRDYDGSEISWDEMDDASVTMNIDQQKYFAFKVDDVDKVQATLKNLENSQLNKASYNLRDVADRFILGKHAEATGGVVTDATCDADTILYDIAKAGRLLEELNVGEGSRFLVIPPWVKEKLRLAGIEFQIKNGSGAGNGIQWAQELGFDLYVSNNVTNLGTVQNPQSQCLAGSYNAILYADQIVDTEGLRLQNYFADGIRGLHVYGGKVVKPNELVKLNLTYSEDV